jgi:hypothetical protein
MCAWVIGELAEAAWHAGRVDAAREHLAKLEAAAGSQPASWIGVGTRHAWAILAPEGNETLFQEALSADLDRWPSRAPAFCSPTANGYGASDALPDRARRSATPATYSTHRH